MSATEDVNRIFNALYIVFNNAASAAISSTIDFE